MSSLWLKLYLADICSFPIIVSYLSVLNLLEQIPFVTIYHNPIQETFTIKTMRDI